MARHLKKTKTKMDPFALIGTLAIAVICLASLMTGVSALMKATNGLDAQNTAVVVASMLMTLVIAAAGAALFIASRRTRRVTL